MNYFDWPKEIILFYSVFLLHYSDISLVSDSPQHQFSTVNWPSRASYLFVEQTTLTVRPRQQLISNDENRRCQGQAKISGERLSIRQLSPDWTIGGAIPLDVCAANKRQQIARAKDSARNQTDWLSCCLQLHSFHISYYYFSNAPIYIDRQI